jgi:hypothetical protein
VTLEQVLDRRSVALLGEPGSGKSTVARATVERVAARGWIPLFAALRSYTGSLVALLANDAPAAIVAGEAVDGVPSTRVLILDGFDEIRLEQFDQFVADLADLLQRDESVRVLITARQAFYATNVGRFAGQQEAFYILDFNERNIRACVEHHGGGYDGFMAEVNRVEVGQEIANPFALEVLFQTFRAGQTLGRLRHEAVERVVESLIASRPDVRADQQRRALRMLAVAMEAASRNELTLDEAVRRQTPICTTFFRLSRLELGSEPPWVSTNAQSIVKKQHSTAASTAGCMPSQPTLFALGGRQFLATFSFSEQHPIFATCPVLPIHGPGCSRILPARFCSELPMQLKWCLP